MTSGPAKTAEEVTALLSLITAPGACAASLETLLSRIQEIQGVRSTQSYGALDTYPERGPMPEVPEPS